jgi:PEP-CTERM motif
MRGVGRILAVVCLVALATTPALAAPITIDFDNLAELEAVTSQFAGLTFTNATVLTAGSTLNEFEFPPASGANVVFDDGPGITITFDDAVFSVSGLFTYVAPVTLTALDANHAVLGAVSSAFATNLALSGDSGSSPNELLQFASLTAIASIQILGDPAGGSFVLDNLSASDVPPPAPVPEPGTLSLVALGSIGLIQSLRRRFGRCG